MTDIEMLELAAKAYFPDCPRISYPLDWVRDCHGNWNPLTDDGDALRLAVTLEMRIDTSKALSVASTSEANEVMVFSDETGDDHYAATRLAIVRAAAEISKTL
jgi:hypothetical protein